MRAFLWIPYRLRRSQMARNGVIRQTDMTTGRQALNRRI